MWWCHFAKNCLLCDSVSRVGLGWTCDLLALATPASGSWCACYREIGGCHVSSKSQDWTKKPTRYRFLVLLKGCLDLPTDITLLCDSLSRVGLGWTCDMSCYSSASIHRIADVFAKKIGGYHRSRKRHDWTPYTGHAPKVLLKGCADLPTVQA